MQEKLLIDPHSGPVKEPLITCKTFPLHCSPLLYACAAGQGGNLKAQCLYTKEFPYPPSLALPTSSQVLLPTLSIPLAILGPASPQVMLAPIKGNGKNWSGDRFLQFDLNRTSSPAAVAMCHCTHYVTRLLLKSRPSILSI